MPKYVDHGAYIPDCSFTASFATSVMTVSAVSSGAIHIGMVIAAAGLAGYTFVASFGTGTGGPGTYNLSTTPGTLASRSCIGSGGTWNLIPPTFGTPQDGDGAGKDPSTASATVNIDLTSATAAAGATISVAGATMTCVASGATVAQFNAGSGATLAANIAAAINRTTNTATIAAPATGWAALPIYVACYARVVGNVLQIMFRAGSATHNGLQVVTSGFTGGTFGPYTFSGGVSGCWGTLVSWTAALLGNTGFYGVWSRDGMLAGTFEANERVDIRTNDRTIFLSNGVVGGAAQFVGNAVTGQPARFVLDNGTVWAGDSATGRIYFVCSPNLGVSQTVSMRMAVAKIISRQYGDNDYGVTFINQGTGAVNLTVDIGSGMVIDGMTLKVSDGNTNAWVTVSNGSSATAGRRSGLLNAYVQHSRAAAFFTGQGAISSYPLDFYNVVVDAAGSVAANPGVFLLTASSFELAARSMKFKNFVIGSRLHNTSLPAITSLITFLDCDFGNISHRGPYMASASAIFDRAGYSTGFSNKGLRDFFQDTAQGFVQWNSVYAQPTLNAKLDDGTTSWSMLVVPSTSSVACSAYRPFLTPRFSVINAAATAQRTLTVEIAISDALAWTKRDISLQIAYVTADGRDVVIDTFDEDAGALTTSTSTWSQESAGKVLYVDSGTLLHNKYKLQITTPTGYDLPLGAEVTATIRIHTAVGNSTQYVFVDPEIQVA